MTVIYLCPECNWEGHANEIKHHFQMAHHEVFSHKNIFDINIETLPKNQLLDIHDDIFLVQTLRENESIIVKLRFMGSPQEAVNIKYDLEICIDETFYKYDASGNAYVTPRQDRWEINLKRLQTLHAPLTTITCILHLQNSNVILRKSLNINNPVVEKNMCDIFESELLEQMQVVERRISQLKQETIQEYHNIAEDIGFFEETKTFLRRKTENGDYMDRVSLLNFSILEEPFSKHVNVCKEELSEDVEENSLICSNCHMPLLPPIYICSTNHNVCNFCSNQPCKVCGSDITIKRNTELENISRTHKHKCKYFIDGCNERLMYDGLRAHEAKCAYCKYKCMVQECPFEDKFDPFVNHLKIIHSSIKISYNMKNEFPKNFQLFVVDRIKGIFYCQSEVSNEFVIWKAYFCGPSERQFFPELTFKGSKFKEILCLRKKDNHMYEIRKPISELKKYKAKDKYAILTITCYD